MALARASAVTTRLKLGTGITLVPERNPLLLAKEVATLDYFSKGRFLFGIGAGWNKEETEIMGGNFAHRWTQTREAIEAMKALWANEAAEYHGIYYDFPLVRSFPRPVQQPHPPIFLGGVAQQVFKRIVAYGNGWMPTRSTPELIRQGRAVLNELAVEAGRTHVDHSPGLYCACRARGASVPGRSRSGHGGGTARGRVRSSGAGAAGTARSAGPVRAQKLGSRE